MKHFSRLFLICCLSVCLVPFAAMAVRPTTESTENRVLSSFPSLRDGDGPNLAFFREFEQYFNEHFAFRNELVCADSVIQAEVFGVSASERVVVGSDGWLYYASTLPDYLGTERMSERELFNTARNLAIADSFVRQSGARLLLAFPPNKNTLYGEHMPYYDSLVADGTHSIDALSPLLAEKGLCYADLAALFRGEEEVYYLKRDSHWNNRGALLAYNRMMDALALPHEDYADAAVTRAFDQPGDLGRMLYTLYAPPGPDYHYEPLQPYERLDGGTAADDAWIETRGAEGRGSLLMFRDSFGNTLYPFFAGAFAEARFTREAPYALETLVNESRPELVIFEKVERNLRDFLTEPPILSAPETRLDGTPAESPCACRFTLSALDYDPRYLVLRGELDGGALDARTELLVELEGRVYEAYQLGENGFLIYLRREPPEAEAALRVLARDEGALRCLWSGTAGEGDAP